MEYIRADFLKIRSRSEAALETERRCSQTKVISESNVTPNTSRSSDFFGTVPPIINGRDWGHNMRDRETIIVLALLSFNFSPNSSHHSLTSPCHGPVTATVLVCYYNFITHGDGTIQPSKWSHGHNLSAYSAAWKEVPW